MPMSQFIHVPNKPKPSLGGEAAARGNAWMVELKQRLSELKNLPEGWAGDASIPVSPEIAEFSVYVLNALYREAVPHPFLIPGTDGSMQMEWHCGGYDIELHVRAPYKIDAWRDNTALGIDDELLITDDLTVIAGWLDELWRALKAN